MTWQLNGKVFNKQASYNFKLYVKEVYTARLAV